MVFNTGSPRESVFLKRNFCSVPISLQKDFSLNNSRTTAPLNSPAAHVCLVWFGFLELGPFYPKKYTDSQKRKSGLAKFLAVSPTSLVENLVHVQPWRPKKADKFIIVF